MGLFSKKKPIAKTRFDKFAIENNQEQYEIRQAMEECISVAEQMREMIPAFKMGTTEYLEVMKVVSNTGKSQPYKEKVSIDTGNDIYHIWFYPSGKVWKAEVNCWPDNDNGYFAHLKRFDEASPLQVKKMGIFFTK